MKELSMSETISAPAPAEGAAEAPISGFDEIAKQLEADGIPPSNMSDEPDDNPDDDPDTADAEEDDGEKITLKVNGKNVQKSMKEVIELAQKYSATEMKLETAKKEITEARAVKEKYQTQSDAIKQLLTVMQKGDVETIHDFVAERLNASEQFNKGVIEYVLRLWEHSKMSPEQKEAHENKKLLTKLRQEQENQKKADADRAHDYAVNQWTQHLDTEIPKALKEIGLPDSEFVRSHIIQTWSAALNNGQNPTALAVANYVKGQLEAAKINFGKADAVPTSTRPRATPEAVKRKSNGGREEPTGYKGWDEWRATRGR